MNSTQFAWLYLIEHGRGGASHNYYGGYNYDPKLTKSIPDFSEWDVKKVEQLQSMLRDKIKQIGVDWKKTVEPSSDLVSEFNGTFADSSHTEILTGTLVLRNGERINWLAKALEVTNVFEMMAQVSESPAKYESVFGEKP